MSDLSKIVSELNRLFPNSCVDVPRDYGHGTEAGHIAHEGEGDIPGVELSHCIGWFCDAGNVGHPVFDIADEDVDDATAFLAGLPDGAGDRSPGGVIWYELARKFRVIIRV